LSRDLRGENKQSIMIVAAYNKFRLWVLAWTYVGLLIFLASLVTRKRMSHNNGVAASGRFKIVPDPRFPAHDFFEPGREFVCRLRHASVSFWDDVTPQVRSASLKLADTNYEAPLDLEMNTGDISVFWSAWNFILFIWYGATRGTIPGAKRFYDRFPGGLLGAQAGVRSPPSSFSQLYYYNETPMLFTGKDGVKRYVKYRLIPEDRGPESGLLTDEEKSHVWDLLAKEDETRSRNYLKQEFEQRITTSGATYHLEMQLHAAAPDDSPEIFNSNVLWDEETHPFLALGTVTLDKMVSFNDCCLTRYSLTQQPPSLGIIPATSLDDYNSMNYMRSVTGPVKATRLFFYKIFGMPKPLPDQGPRN